MVSPIFSSGRIFGHVLDAELTHGKPCLVYTGGFRSCSQNICFVGYVVGRCEPMHLVEEAALVSKRSCSAVG